MSDAGSRADRRERLQRSRLYLVLDTGAVERVVAAALRGGTDVVQLRDKEAGEETLLAAGERARAQCADHGALFLVNDRPDLALALDADGCHVGQGDLPPEAVRAELGGERLIGLSTHSAQQFDAGLDSEADYLSVGPIHATPTKPGRAPTGVALVEHAAACATKPFFAIGGIAADTIAPVLAAGAERVAVVRAIAAATDPGAAAAELRGALDAHAPEGAGVGAQ